MPRFLLICRLAVAAAAVAWTAAIPLLSLLPPSCFSEASWLGRIPGIDKIIHALLYGVQTALLIGAWHSFRSCDRVRILACAAGATAYGALMEVLQRTLTETRQFSWGDMAANTLGAFLVAGLVIGWLAVSVRRRSTCPGIETSILMKE